jgi:predicted nucleotidyltransferase
MINANVRLPTEEQIADFCRRHHIRRLAVFGSALGDDFDSDSDLDLLAEFDDGHTPGFEFVTIADELSVLFGRSVDLNTARSIHPRYRDRVLRDSQLLHAA